MYFIYKQSKSYKVTALSISTAMIIMLISVVIYNSLGGLVADWYIIEVAVIVSSLLISYRIISHPADLVHPVPEISSVGTKSLYKLLQGRVYVIAEEKPKFAFRLFSVILRSRCFDCRNDESFVCESLDCSSCNLPCPCRECQQYPHRTQGLVVTRRHPDQIRETYFIQTTPFIWLTTIPGKNNMDPAKLSLLTDMVVKFIEKSQNSVVLIEGIEYLVMSNDFYRVLKAINRWSEITMASSSRLIISLNPKAFDVREMALIERNRELVKPRDVASMEKILASSS